MTRKPRIMNKPPGIYMFMCKFIKNTNWTIYKQGKTIEDAKN